MTEIIREGKNSTKLTADVPLEAKTMVITQTKGQEKAIGPRLVCTSVSGQSKIYPLDKTKLVIGRSVEADLNLHDPLVSRKHCVIEKRNNEYVIRNVSTTNPLLLNEIAIAEKRLYRGDQLKIGNATLVFISDRPEDVRKAEIKPGTQETKSGWGFWLSIFLLLLFAGYFGYFQAYAPLRVKLALKSVSKQIKAEKYEPAYNALVHLIGSDLTQENTQQVMELLAETALAISEQKARHEDLESVMAYLKEYLSEYGAGKEAEVLWDRLDYYRLTLAHRLESAHELQPALQQYSAIKEDSIYYEEAHKAIRRIWLAHQQHSRQDQTLVQLLKEADAHFQAQQYLKPVNQNAFVLYRAVLTLEPGHELALKRIDQMKEFYRVNGEKYFSKKKWTKTLSYFERYYLIDTDNKQVNNKMKICREKLSDARILARKSKPTKTSLKKKSWTKSKKDRENEQAEKKEEIKRLLEESGAESSWIMKYLFEDETDKKNSDKPW
ncbi:MAG: FHA domain-containing protein [Deltaproteobacteria bacterium]|nr:FHA domain-containing protein [Deltaproteobacteria bacterium]